MHVTIKNSEPALVWSRLKGSPIQSGTKPARLIIDDLPDSSLDWIGKPKKKVFYYGLSEYDKWLYEIRGGEMPKKRIFSSDHGRVVNMDNPIIYQPQRSVVRGIRSDIMDAVDLSFAPVDHDLTLTKHSVNLTRLFVAQGLARNTIGLPYDFSEEINGTVPQIFPENSMISQLARSNKLNMLATTMLYRHFHHGGKSYTQIGLTEYYRRERKAFEKEEKNKTK